ncbi:MAG: CDP-glucose 4,6-dehydratase [Desulfobulbus sp.]|nr:CDP-glucose 4,6-dehydratase [Desulfobulbus sp.]
MTPAAAFWRGKRVLVTGDTGFKGGWLTRWLLRLGAEVSGLALPPPTQPSLFDAIGPNHGYACHMADIRDYSQVKQRIAAVQPHIVFHLAAQALVRASYDDPLATWATNVQGTAHVLDALRQESALKVAIFITTDKVYRNREFAYPYREDDELGGHDPYSASKAACELLIASYRQSFFAQSGVAIASARAGNVIGGGDWAADRIIPDAIRAWQNGQPLRVRNPASIRPWQHVLEPLGGYLRLAEHLWAHPEAAGPFNFGPRTDEAASVGQLIAHAQTSYPDALVNFASAPSGPHEAGWLALEIAKARHILGWQPVWSVEQAVQRTMRWYRDWQQGADPIALCDRDIDAYESRRP